MRQRIWTPKKGSEIPEQYDGVTIPIDEPENLAEAVKLDGEEAVGKGYNAQRNLAVQKRLKLDMAKTPAPTLDELRTNAQRYSREIASMTRQRVVDPSKPVSATTVKRRQVQQKASLADQMLADLRKQNPELAKQYEAKLAAQAAPVAAPAAGNGQPTTAAAPAAGDKKVKAGK